MDFKRSTKTDKFNSVIDSIGHPIMMCEKMTSMTCIVIISHEFILVESLSLEKGNFKSDSSFINDEK